MALEITIGAPQLVIHQGEVVWDADPDGQLDGETTRGLMFRDTRLIALWSLYANGAPWKLLNSGAINHFAARAYMTNPTFDTLDGTVAEHTLSLMLGRWIDGGVHEDIDIGNYGKVAVRFNLELSIRADFSDVFEVKSNHMVRRGQIATVWDDAAHCLTNSYRNEDFYRAVAMRVHSDTPAAYANGRLSFNITVQPGGTWHACMLSDLVDGSFVLHAPTPCTGANPDSSAGITLAAWRREATKLQTSNEEYYRLYRQAIDDMAALRLPITTDGVVNVIPAAGLPWFVALFGRDSLIASLQMAPITTEFARGALAILGAQQATERDDYRDAEPGKILHEMRLGELAHFKLIPHTPYYGTADATPLYLMVLHEAWKWTGDRTLLERYLPIAEGCLDWIDNWGDRDGDGFQEYQTRSSKGYENVGWKDSEDGVLNADGSMVKGPKALCELQGYVYGAWTGMADIYDALERPERAATMRRKAAEMQVRFEAAFWNEAWGGFAYALDGDKKQVLSSVSNIGHCLYTGLIRPQRARQVAARLLAPEMFSGWGVRTLAGDHPAFNPFSYHNGSIWPHDNGLIAVGLARYGLHDDAARVARAVSGAAGFFTLHQVPELFAGTIRNDSNFPVQFLGSNVPQAWAAGSAFSFLQAIVGFQPDAAAGMLYLDPQLPDWLPDVLLHDVTVGEMSFDLRLTSQGGVAEIEVLRGPAERVRRRARA